MKNVNDYMMHKKETIKKMKNVLWQSEERRVEVATGYHPPRNVFDEMLEEWRGRPVQILLGDGSKLDVIIVSSDACLIGVKRFIPKYQALEYNASVQVVPVREIASVTNFGIENVSRDA